MTITRMLEEMSSTELTYYEMRYNAGEIFGDEREDYRQGIEPFVIDTFDDRFDEHGNPTEKERERIAAKVASTFNNFIEKQKALKE